jgi:hypothetical protein
VCYPNSAEEAYFQQREPISTLKPLSCNKYSFQKLSQFSQGGNVLDAPASNTGGFHLGDACVSSTQMNRLIWNHHFENLWRRKYSFQKVTQLSQ